MMIKLVINHLLQKRCLHEWDKMLAILCMELETANTGLRDACAKVKTLSREVKVQTDKAKRYWDQKCEQLLAEETVIEEKDTEIAKLQELITSCTWTTTVATGETFM